MVYDVIVLGVGGMGSAAAFHLARRGRRVLGLEQFDVPHDLGSSHGQTRIIRLAYHEHPAYVPFVRRSFALWRDLERSSGERLLHVTGSLDVGPVGGDVVAGSLQSCREHGLPHETLDAATLTRRFPALRFPEPFVGVFQSDGGFLLPERCVVGHVQGALDAGAEIHGRERVIAWEPRGESVVVRTERATYEAGHLVVCAGAWAGKLLADLTPLAVPERQVMTWLQPRTPAHFQVGQLPVFVAEVGEGLAYGLPIHGVPGFKFGLHHHRRQVVDPDRLDRSAFEPADETLILSIIRRYLPDADGPILAQKTCLYTNSPDGHFIIDVHPHYPRVSIAAGFSGHGFKFSSAVGEVMADLAETGSTRHDIDLFRLARFARAIAP